MLKCQERFQDVPLNVFLPSSPPCRPEASLESSGVHELQVSGQGPGLQARAAGRLPVLLPLVTEPDSHCLLVQPQPEETTVTH